MKTPESHRKEIVFFNKQIVFLGLNWLPNNCQCHKWRCKYPLILSLSLSVSRSFCHSAHTPDRAICLQSLHIKPAANAEANTHFQCVEPCRFHSCRVWAPRENCVQLSKDEIRRQEAQHTNCSYRRAEPAPSPHLPMPSDCSLVYSQAELLLLLPFVVVGLTQSQQTSLVIAINKVKNETA